MSPYHTNMLDPSSRSLFTIWIGCVLFSWLCLVSFRFVCWYGTLIFFSIICFSHEFWTEAEMHVQIYFIGSILMAHVINGNQFQMELLQVNNCDGLLLAIVHYCALHGIIQCGIKWIENGKTVNLKQTVNKSMKSLTYCVFFCIVLNRLSPLRSQWHFVIHKMAPVFLFLVIKLSHLHLEIYESFYSGMVHNTKLVCI